MTRQEALDLLHTKMQNTNLRRHCYAVEAVMRSLAEHLDHAEEREEWAIAGLLHDVDYEEVKEEATIKHTIVALEWLEEKGVSESIKNAIARHAWGFVDAAPEPQTDMDWALYTCDELTGFIVAVALTRPDRKLSSVEVSSILKKWKQKAFAAGVHREQIELCDKKLGIKLEAFIDIALQAMQAIHKELGL